MMKKTARDYVSYWQGVSGGATLSFALVSISGWIKKPIIAYLSIVIAFIGLLFAIQSKKKQEVSNNASTESTGDFTGGDGTGDESRSSSTKSDAVAESDDRSVRTGAKRRVRTPEP